MKTDLKSYNNSWYSPGKGFLIRTLWYFVNAIIFTNHLIPFSQLKVLILKCFGAKVGTGVVIKPNVNIKYPWLLTIGDYSWIGESVWIDNLAQVTIGNNCCISQGALLLCGNHNFKNPNFDLIVKEIHIKDGAWVGAKSVICPGVTVGEDCVITVGSVIRHSTHPNNIISQNETRIRYK